MLVAVKLIVVWKIPVTITAIHDVGQNDPPRASMTANRISVASHVRCMLSTIGWAACSANFMTIQLLPQMSVRTASAT
jgi:hypothetical protein